MKKKIGFVFSIMIVAAVIIGYYSFQNQNRPSVGMNEDVVNEDQKQGTTSLDSDKVLVVYFSNGGNTQKLAKEVFDQVGGDFRRIEPATPYAEGEELYDVTKAEQENDERPVINDLDIDISHYDTIFIGYPIWWYTYPQIVLSFLDEYDVSNKTIIPFATHGGSRMSGTEDVMRAYLDGKGVTVLDGLAVSRDVIQQDQSEAVAEWLTTLGF